MQRGESSVIPLGGRQSRPS